MRSQVTVTWDDAASYRFDLDEVQPMPHDHARSWLDDQFVAFGCEPVRLTGKVLTADKVLAIAQAAGSARFGNAAERHWSMSFARATSAALGKPVVTVDLAALTVGY